MAILQSFLDFSHTSAEKILLQARKNSGMPQFEIEKMVKNYLDWRASKGYATSTVAKEAGIISGFFRANNIILKIGKRYALIPVYEGKSYPTQNDVRKMIDVTEGLEKRAVICFEAQTAQRIGILTGLTWNMIPPKNRYPVKGTNKVYGVIEVMPEIVDRNNRSVNKTRVPYSFGIHWQTMKLLDELKKQRKDKSDPYIFTINKRRMQEAIVDAADRAGIQTQVTRKLKVEKRDKNGKLVKSKMRKWNSIHAHVFRRFWMAQMDKAGIKNKDLLHFQLGHNIKYLTYERGWFVNDKIIEAIKQADTHLRVLP